MAVGKIGILTFHKSINYGSVLQAYALQKKVEKLGHTVEIIDYEPNQYKHLYGLFRKPVNIRNIKFDWINLRFFHLLKTRKKNFETFRSNYLRLSKEKFCYGENVDCWSDQYSTILTGSDQIWNPLAKDSDENYFLPIPHKVNKVAYAVSLNDGFAEEFQNPDLYKNRILEYDAISVREESARRDLDSFLDKKKEIKVVLDPTLLHSKEDFYEICEKRIVDRPYIFFYSVNHSDDAVDAVAKLSKRTGLPVYMLFTNIRSRRTVNLHKEFHYLRTETSPQAFVSLVRYADYVVTDSFHGTAFSIIFEKNFYSIGKKDKNGNKIRDERICGILEKLGLLSRFISSTEIASVDIQSEIDYSGVKQIRESLIRDSEKYLKRSIK